jgi:RNA polymerase sigma-70 factor (ECF subfamily)
MESIAGSHATLIYRGYHGKVLRRARQLLRDEQAAEDATQDVFVELLSVGDRMLLHPRPLAWLYRVTTNLCLNRLRDEGRRRRLVARSLPDDEPRGGGAEVRAIVVDILRRVPDDLREIAIHYHRDGMTCAEIAAVLRVSRRTIGNRLEAFQSAAASVDPPRRMPQPRHSTQAAAAGAQRPRLQLVVA